MKKLIFLGISLVMSFNIFGQTKGKIYSDLNNNRTLDKNEPGIANVLVSNGSEVVKTDKTGNYEISLKPGEILFVIKPHGWKFPLDKNNLSQFYYIYKPEGSPTTKYMGSQPTGALPSSIDFPLYASAEPDNFKLFLFGDPQPANVQETEFLAKDVISEVAGDTVCKFGISLGDIVSDNLNDYPFVKSSFAQIGLPWYNVMGNHDLNFDAPSDKHTGETFEATFGPATYAFQYAKAHFIVLDDVVYGEQSSGKNKYIGGFRPDQLQFIKNYLAFVPKDELIVLCMHIPLFQEIATYYKDINTFRPEDRQQLFDILKEHQHTFSVSAHTHYQMHYFFKAADGWNQTMPHHHFNAGATCGDWFRGLQNPEGYPDATMRDGTPNGYTIMTVQGNTYKLKYKAAGMHDNKQMSITIAASDTLAQSQKYVYVNFYMGNELCKASCRFDNMGSWASMVKTEEFDPRMVAMKKALANLDSKAIGRQVSDPQPCWHLWKLELPSQLEKGYHTVEVRVTDMYNEVHIDKLVFLVK